MSSTKEIKARMGAVRETKQITNAMYLIASTKLRHAREDLDKTRPYFDALRSEIVRVIRADEDEISRYFFDADGTEPGGVCGILVITADKGLAGAYNLNVIRQAEALLKEKPGARLFVMGEYGRRWFLSHRAPVEPEFLYNAENPTLDRVREICSDLLERYEDGLLDEIVVVYTDMKSSLSSAVRYQRLLPLERGRFREAKEREGASGPAADFEFIPSREEVLGVVLRSYISGFIYSAMVDSFCAEQNARVAAMDAAGRNAEQLLGDLSLQLNRERQAAITQEITEISAGAKAQRNHSQSSGL